MKLIQWILLMITILICIKSLLNNDNRYIKVTLKSKLIGVAGELISADYREF